MNTEQNETIEHVILHGQEYEQEQRHMIENLRKIKVQFDLKVL